MLLFTSTKILSYNHIQCPHKQHNPIHNLIYFIMKKTSNQQRKPKWEESPAEPNQYPERSMQSHIFMQH